VAHAGVESTALCSGGRRPGIGVLASVFELEGLSLVTTQEQADRAGLAYDFVADWITLRV